MLTSDFFSRHVFPQIPLRNGMKENQVEISEFFLRAAFMSKKKTTKESQTSIFDPNEWDLLGCEPPPGVDTQTREAQTLYDVDANSSDGESCEDYLTSFQPPPPLPGRYGDLTPLEHLNCHRSTEAGSVQMLAAKDDQSSVSRYTRNVQEQAARVAKLSKIFEAEPRSFTNLPAQTNTILPPSKPKAFQIY